jgi:chromate transporter
VQNERQSLLAIFFIFLRLGLTSFGGPVAHLGYFRHEFVEKRKWLDEHAYADLVALCQFLPGPASSQVGISLGLARAGIPGALAAWLGFTLPSAILLVLFALSLGPITSHLGFGWLHGLKLVAVAVVAQAIWAMGRVLCPDLPRGGIATGAAALALLLPACTGLGGAIAQIGAIVAGGLVGWAFLRSKAALPHSTITVPTGRKTGAAALAVFLLLLVLSPLVAAGAGSHALQLFAGFFRTGSLVFGGGHVVLPLLQAQVVPTGWVSNDVFLAGYGAAQAVPGPLFTFAAYLGAASSRAPAGWAGAGIALAAIFLPSFLLMIGILPFWEQLRRHAVMQRAMLGINAAVVGILAAAFYSPVWSSTIHRVSDAALALAAWALLAVWKLPPWLVVLMAAVASGVAAQTL